MLDQCQKFPRNQLYVTCHVHSRHESAEDKEFGFCSAWEFQAQACIEEDLGAHSPRLWETNTKYESSPLLPQNHHYSDLSPTSRRRVILESRSELMQMIQNMPESYHELSLKDIVDEQQGMQKAREGTDVEEKSLDFNTQVQIRKQKKKITYKTRQISRTSSMESETFLIKMFFPTFLGSKKKAKAAGNRSKVSPRPSFEDPENHKDLCVEGTSSGRRFSEDDTLPGCWTFFRSKKGKSKRLRAC
ncbi:hypothetical protein ABKV19_008247 [Rosa sericea]